MRLRAFSNVGADHPVWADRPYKVFLYTPEDVQIRVKYVEENPEKEGLPRPPEAWEFVKAYDNWPLHKRRRSEHAKTPPEA